MLKKIVVVFLAVNFISIVGYSRCEEAMAQAADEDAQLTEKVSITKEGNVSLDFREADIKNVFKILAFKSGVNIVASPDVTGTVSIQLNDVPWQQALDVILQTYGYAYERKGNVIVVTTVENLKKRREDSLLLAEQEPIETRTFTLNFGKAADIIASIEKMKSERGSINFDERTNTLIITDTSRQLDLVAEVINTLDRTTPQVLIEAKIVETTFVDTENLGIDWLTKATIGGTKRPITFPFSDTTNSRFTPDGFPGADEGLFS